MQSFVLLPRSDTSTGKAGAILYLACRLILVAVFLLSGISKAIYPGEFATIIGAYGLLPDGLVVPAALCLIGLEIVAAVGLLLEKRGSLSLITLMMLLFIAVLSYGIYLGLDVDCGCFGPDDPEAEAFHDLRGALVRDLFLCSAIVYMYVWRFICRFEPKAWLK